MQEFNSIIVLGATATGKTKLAVALAEKNSGEIISADSRQVYKGLDLGSGKDLEEYGSVPYHLIDIADLEREYNLFDFQNDVYRIFPEIIAREKLPIIAGGTALYLDSIIHEYNLLYVPMNKELRSKLGELSIEELQDILLEMKQDVHNKTDLQQRKRLIRAIEIAAYTKDNPEEIEKLAAARPKIAPKILGIKYPRDIQRDRIKKRLLERIDKGLIEEVEGLYKSGVSWRRLESLGLEYRITAYYIKGRIKTKDEYIDSLHKAICKFAKHQETWFRKFERKGIKIEWINPEEALPALTSLRNNSHTPPL